MVDVTPFYIPFMHKFVNKSKYFKLFKLVVLSTIVFVSIASFFKTHTVFIKPNSLITLQLFYQAHYHHIKFIKNLSYEFNLNPVMMIIFNAYCLISQSICYLYHH